MKLISTPFGPTDRVSLKSLTAQLTTPLDQTWLDRINTAWLSSTPEELNAAHEWWTNVDQQLEAWIDGTTVTLDMARGIVSALSPRMHWNINMLIACQVIRSHTADENTARPQFSSNRDKANRILAGESPYAVLGIFKTGAFYLNLSGDNSRATVDTWVNQAITGSTDAPTPQTYIYLERHVLHAASALLVPTRDIVARLWIAQRGSDQ